MSLKLQSISKRYGDKWILRLINGDENVNTGSILFDETEIATNSATERGFSFAQDGEQTSWKDLFRSTKSEDISDGLKKKITIEKTLEGADKVVLLDNPFSGMNYEMRDEVYELLRKTVKEKNLAMIIATNNLDSAFAACDRLAILQNGEIVQFDEPRALYEKPNSVAVARVLGRSNFISAMRVTFNNQPTQEFQTLDGDHRLLTDKTERKGLGAINSPITLAIRPEHISISFGASFPEDNLLKAKIIDVRYLGATTLLKLDANGLILESLVLRLVGLKIGDECMVGLPPDRFLVLKD